MWKQGVKGAGLFVSTTALRSTGPDLKVDQMVDWIRFERVQCGGPIGTWPITVSGPFAADYMIVVEGVPLTTGGENAAIRGSAASPTASSLCRAR
ncbi:MAG TPA: hypothetical protein VF855_00910 [Acidimicrobiales bacterium]